MGYLDMYISIGCLKLAIKTPAIRLNFAIYSSLLSAHTHACIHKLTRINAYQLQKSPIIGYFIEQIFIRSHNSHVLTGGKKNVSTIITVELCGWLLRVIPLILVRFFSRQLCAHIWQLQGLCRFLERQQNSQKKIYKKEIIRNYQNSE